MADKYQQLLIEWCDALVRAQITDKKDEYYGGFACKSCAFPHGRADNAVYPLVYAFVLTGKTQYLTAAERLLVFRKKLTKPSGAVQNDFSSAWEGITAFSAIGLLKTLLYFGDRIPLSFKKEIETCARRSAGFVHQKMGIGFPAYINYYCAASLVNALYDEYFHDDAYRARSKELLDYCLGLFTPNGLLAGEGKPHDDRSPKGCLPIDIGYIAEESMPCLIHAASVLNDHEALSFLTQAAKRQLDFFLPDGGWDNSFGVRNNKWTYYGSRTSDGCIGAFAYLAKTDPLFSVAADRVYRLLKACTSDGLLYGGPHYLKTGQNPCIHHTFCHAAALADALHEGITEPSEPLLLPLEKEEIGYRFYPELNTYRIRAGDYIATVSGYDYATHHYAGGAAHAGGGTISLLYKNGAGALIAGSVYEYFQTEPNNMQAPVGDKKHASLLPRAEYEKEGVKYATCLDKDPQITLEVKDGAVLAHVKAKFFAAKTERAEDESLVAEFTYRFAGGGVTIKMAKNPSVTFVLPLVEGAGEIQTQNPYQKQPIFFLTGGFSAVEYTFSCEDDLVIKIV